MKFDTPRDILPGKSILFIETRFFPKRFRRFVPIRLQTAIPINHEDEPVASDSFLSDEDLLEIIKARCNPEESLISTVFGRPDFLPFSFMDLGIKRGNSVCRIVQKEYSDRFYDEIIKAIDELEDNPESIKLTERELVEIFAISEKERNFAEEFFELSKKIAGFDESVPSTALKNKSLFEKLLPIPTGTAFLVGSSYLLTNNHVLPTNKVCLESLAQFGYEQDMFGRKIEPVEYEFDPEGFFETCPELDYTLVKLKDRPQKEKFSPLNRAGDSFGWIPLTDDNKSIAPPLSKEKVEQLYDDGYGDELNKLGIKKTDTLVGDPVNIIQHPKGKRKQVILSSNRVIEIQENIIRYEADADFSSSGSPVFNQQWNLVGLHHAAVGNRIEKNGMEMYEIVAEQGIRTCKIVKNLIEKAESYQEAFNKELGEQGKPVQAWNRSPNAAKIDDFIDKFVERAGSEPSEKSPTPSYSD